MSRFSSSASQILSTTLNAYGLKAACRDCLRPVMGRLLCDKCLKFAAPEPVWHMTRATYFRKTAGAGDKYVKSIALARLAHTIEYGYDNGWEKLLPCKFCDKPGRGMSPRNTAGELCARCISKLGSTDKEVIWKTKLAKGSVKEKLFEIAKRKLVEILVSLEE